jgi:CheY-like chemotaxis protein
MRQLVLGLVFNAAEAIGDAKGTVTVSTSHVADGQELADAAPLHDEIPAGPCVVLRVEDDGEGMDPATVSRIFEPFFTTRFTGRGLGLAAALGIVRGHEGAIDVESAPGRGSTFTVYLPAETGERSADRTRRSGRDTSTSTVLVVDDEESVLRTTERMLHRLGYRVVLAATGEEALSQLGAHHSEIDAVLLDLELPDMDGVETFREIRLVSRGLPVIVSSGYSERTVEEQFRGGDIAGFIQKPYDMESLRRTLQELD